MTTVTELKELFIKLGGDPEKVKGLQTDAEVIDLLKTTNLGIELPTTTTADEGKILQVDSEGNWDKADAPVELPAVTSEDNGSVLKVSDGTWGKGENEALPAVTSEDEGKILQVDSEGSWGKADMPTELPSVSAKDYGKILRVNSAGKWWAGYSNISRNTKTVTISQASDKLQFDIGSASSNGVVVGFFIKDSTTKTLLNGKTVRGACEITVSGTLYNTSKFVLTTSDGTFSAGTYTVEVYIDYDDGLLN